VVSLSGHVVYTPHLALKGLIEVDVTYSEVSVVLRARKLLGSYLLKFRPLFSFVLATFVHQAIQTGQQHSRMVHASVHKGSQPNIARN